MNQPADDERMLLAQAEEYSRAYLAGVSDRRVFPDHAAISALQAFHEALPERGSPPNEVLARLHKLGSPATVASNGPSYFGFVIGAALPIAQAAERLALAWDQCASSPLNSPVAAELEAVAGDWIKEILDLPRASAVSFGTSASACGLTCLAAARRALLLRQGWDLDRCGLAGAPSLRVVVSELAHITVIKALRILGFGSDQLISAPVDEFGRVDPDRLPMLDERSILCLQAGEVNTGEFDPFVALIGRARRAGAWVHVDGAFGLWARANSSTRHLTEGIDAADSWTTDGHKWLNTPYDSAMAICRDADHLASVMNSDAAYSMASHTSQKNLGLEFSRRARGIAIWAALCSLGRQGVAELVDRHCRLASHLAEGLRAHGIEVLNRVVLNQVLARLGSDQATHALRELANATGAIWFGPAQWRGRAAFRLSVSSWRTTELHIDSAVALLGRLRAEPLLPVAGG